MSITQKPTRYNWEKNEDSHRFAIETYLNELDGHTNLGPIDIVKRVTDHIHRPDLKGSVRELMRHISFALKESEHLYLDVFSPNGKFGETLRKRVHAIVAEREPK